MSREVDIDAAVLAVAPPPDHGGAHSNGAMATESAPTSQDVVGSGGGSRQPVADANDSRRKPVMSTSLQLDSTGPAAGNATVSKPASHQQKLREIRAMAPLEAAKLYKALSSKNPTALRQSAALLDHLVRLMYIPDRNGSDLATVRAMATDALTSVIKHTSDDDQIMKMWELLRLVWFHCELLRVAFRGGAPVPISQHAATISNMTELMTMSFEADIKDALRSFGGQICMTTLLRLDHWCYPELRPQEGSNNPADGQQAFSLRNSVRVHACTVLCNLLVNTPVAKSELARTQGFLGIIKKQLGSPLEELVHVSATLLQNLSFHSDNRVKSELSDANIIPAIVSAAAVAQMKRTVVALTSALWNMSAHSSESYESNNKAALCSANGGLDLIVQLLDFQGDDDKSMKIFENTTGILQNVSSHIVRNPPLLIYVRQLGIYPALSRCLRRRIRGPVLRMVVGSLSNFAAGMAEDKEAIRVSNIIPLLEDIASSSSQQGDPKICLYAKQALNNLSLVPVSAPRRASAPQHTQSDSYIGRRGSPLTVDSQVETSFRPSPTSSNSEIHDSSVIDPSLVHRSVPGRMPARRKQRLDQVQQFFNSRENLAVSDSRENLRPTSVENVRSAVSADNIRGGLADLPQKPPRRRTVDITANQGTPPLGGTPPASEQPSPFFSAQEPTTMRVAPKPSSGTPETWHARSQSDSAATVAHIPSNRLRTHGHRDDSPDDVYKDSNDSRTRGNGHGHHRRQMSSDSGRAPSGRQLLSPSPTAPSGSQEIKLSQPIVIPEETSPRSSLLGPVNEGNVSITDL